jgi:hypothetical protein
LVAGVVLSGDRVALDSFACTVVALASTLTALDLIALDLAAPDLAPPDLASTAFDLVAFGGAVAAFAFGFTFVDSAAADAAVTAASATAFVVRDAWAPFRGVAGLAEDGGIEVRSPEESDKATAFYYIVLQAPRQFASW